MFWLTMVQVVKLRHFRVTCNKRFSPNCSLIIPSFWYLPGGCIGTARKRQTSTGHRRRGGLSCMHTHETYQVSFYQSACHNRFWAQEAIMDLAFWEICIDFFVMQMKHVAFTSFNWSCISGSRHDGRTSVVNVDYKIKIEGFQLFTSVDIVRQVSEL